MKPIPISVADRKKLKKLGSDQWMAEDGKHLSPRKVIHLLIDAEYRKAFPPPVLRWRSLFANSE
jgi:hypothetical protein